MRSYVAFCDPSGGSSDSMTLAISHLSLLNKCVLDLALEKRPPFSPDAVVEEFAAVLRTYRVASVVGDKYGGEWPAERFRVHGIRYQPSELTRSEIYSTFLALANSGRVRIHGDRRLRIQFQSLERRASRTGKDIVDHPAGSHDDVANAVAGALVLAMKGTSAPQPWIEFLPRGAEESEYKNLARDDSGPECWWHKLS